MQVGEVGGDGREGVVEAATGSGSVLIGVTSSIDFVDAAYVEYGRWGSRGRWYLLPYGVPEVVGLELPELPVTGLTWYPHPR